MVWVTKHAQERMKERINVPKRSLISIGRKAFVRGQKRLDLKGGIRRYLDKLYAAGRYNGKNTDLVVYGQYVFVIADGRDIVTTFKLPKKLQNTKKYRVREEPDSGDHELASDGTSG